MCVLCKKCFILLSRKIYGSSYLGHADNGQKPKNKAWLNFSVSRGEQISKWYVNGGTIYEKAQNHFDKCRKKTHVTPWLLRPEWFGPFSSAPDNNNNNVSGFFSYRKTVREKKHIVVSVDQFKQKDFHRQRTSYTPSAAIQRGLRFLSTSSSHTSWLAGWLDS